MSELSRSLSKQFVSKDAKVVGECKHKWIDTAIGWIQCKLCSADFDDAFHANKLERRICELEEKQRQTVKYAEDAFEEYKQMIKELEEKLEDALDDEITTTRIG